MTKKIMNIISKLLAIYFIGVILYLWLNFNGSIKDKIYFLILIIFTFIALFPDRTGKIFANIWKTIKK